MKIFHEKLRQFICIILAVFPFALGLAVGTVGSIWPNMGILFFIGGFFLLAWWFISQISSLVSFVRSRNHPRSALLLALITIALPSGRWGLQQGDYAHLFLFYPKYYKEVQEWHGNPDHITFDWGTAHGLLTSQAQKILYYDRNDNLSKYEGVQPSSSNGGDSATSFEITKHLIGHFYVITNWDL